MTPENAHTFLFSDILNMQVAQKEYNYFKRVLQKAAEVHEIGDLLTDILQMENVKKTEGERILGKIKDRDYVYALAILGKERTSEEFASEIENLTTYGRSNLAFVIGGSLGLSEDVLKRADSQISFGRFTMPHQLMRLVLTEQIYRAFMINSGSPYHK